MNKVFGIQSDFAYVRDDGSRYVIGYNLQPVDGDDEHFTWNEVYLYKRQQSLLALQDVKQAIINDINAQTDERILSGFAWTPEGGESVPVWLSSENQFNFKAAFDLAMMTEGATLPVTFKLGEQEDGTPVYHEFATVGDLQSFYTGAVAYINRTLAEGWQEKDALDFSPYEALFPVAAEGEEQPAE